jgi:hypothetical protein
LSRTIEKKNLAKNKKYEEMSQIIFVYEGKKILSKDLHKYVEQNRIFYYGEIKCQSTVKSTNLKCSNNSYYLENGKYLCGVHSVKDTRIKLQKNPKKKEESAHQIKLHEEKILELSAVQKNKNLRGQCKCFKMKMMGSVLLIEGFRNVFPNSKHQNRIDGFGCSSLSPMKLGPVIHNQKDLPVALNIENFYQFNKVYPCEVDKTGNPTKEFRKRQTEGYNDPIAHRHKFNNKIRPLYSVYKTRRGKEKRFTYVQSRYFYCCVYELLAKKEKDYKTLAKFLKKGINIMICGYDAYEVTKNLYEHYIDIVRPFGHELVLYTLLTIKNTHDYPWHIYRRTFPDVYSDIDDPVF